MACWDSFNMPGDMPDLPSQQGREASDAEVEEYHRRVAEAFPMSDDEWGALAAAGPLPEEDQVFSSAGVTDVYYYDAADAPEEE
jgi:hypothetical protein